MRTHIPVAPMQKATAIRYVLIWSRPNRRNDDAGAVHLKTGGAGFPRLLQARREWDEPRRSG